MFSLSSYVARAAGVAAFVVAANCVVPTAQAVPINGSIAISMFNVLSTGSIAFNVGSILSAGPIYYAGSASGDFVPVPSGTALSSYGSLDTALGSTWSFDSVYGTFSGTVTHAALHTDAGQVLSVYLLGTYTGEGPFSGYDALSPASLTLSFTLTGNSISESGTLAAPPADIPEPISAALLVVGMTGVGVAARRRRAV